MIEQYESDGDSKSRKGDGSRRHVPQNMNSNLEFFWDVEQEMYETLSRGIVLEPKFLQTKKQLARHHVSLVDVGVEKEAWIRGS